MRLPKSYHLKAEVYGHSFSSVLLRCTRVKCDNYHYYRNQDVQACVDAKPTRGKLQAAVQGPAVTAENTVAWVATEKVSTGRKAIAK